MIVDLFNAIKATREEMLMDIEIIEELNDMDDVHLNKCQLHEGDECKLPRNSCVGKQSIDLKFVFGLLSKYM